MSETPGSSAASGCRQYFSPEDDIQAVWVDHISRAVRSIHIAAFGIENRAIIDALKAACGRGVEVTILLDHKQAALRSDAHVELAAAGATIIIKHSIVLLHDKMGVFDGQASIVGSWNLSGSAEQQDNSVCVFESDPTQAGRDEHAFEWMFHRETGLEYHPAVSQSVTVTAAIQE